MFDVPSDLLKFHFISASNDHSIECNQPVVCHFLGLFEKVDDHLDHIVSQWLLNFVTDFHQDGLQEVAKRILDSRSLVHAHLDSCLKFVKYLDH